MAPPTSQIPWDSRYASNRSSSRGPTGLRALFANRRMLLVLAAIAFFMVLYAIGARGEDAAPIDEVQQLVVDAESRAGYPDVRVAIEGRTATLTGTVDTNADVLAAGAVARSVEVVTLVENNLLSRETADPEELEPEIREIISTSAELDFQASLSTLAAINPIQFESSVDELVSGSSSILDAIAAKLTENTQVTIEIQGHTDADGDEAENEALSLRRAERVKAELVARGTPEAQLEVQGYGESLPVSDNETQEGKARNRRIEFRIVPGISADGP